MAKTQIKVGFWRRLFGWSGRHKVIAAFSVLFLVIFLFFAGSWVILQVQIHFERERFDRAAKKMEDVQHALQSFSVPTPVYLSKCTHSNFGAIFEVDTISCDTEVTMKGSSLSKDDFIKLTQTVRQIVSKQELSLRRNPRVYDSDSNTSYDFRYQGLACSLDASYYDPLTSNSLPVWVAYPDRGETAGLIDVGCGGKARQDYFPVTDN